jgi:hypothetical protein
MLAAHSRRHALKGHTHSCYLAIGAVREHPVGPGTPQPVADRSALDGAQPCSQSGCPGPPDLAELMADLKGRAIMAMARWGPGVHQQSIRNYRHNDGAPVSGRLSDAARVATAPTAG